MLLVSISSTVLKRILYIYIYIKATYVLYAALYYCSKTNITLIERDCFRVNQKWVMKKAVRNFYQIKQQKTPLTSLGENEITTTSLQEVLISISDC